MEELKVELLKIGKDKGDTGDTDVQKEWINYFLDALLKYLTEEAIRSFTPYDIRALYIVWFKEYMKAGSFEDAESLILHHIELSMEPRAAVASKPTGTNVQSIFRKA